MTAAGELRRSFHGFGIRVIAPAAILAALESRLYDLPQEDALPVLTFEYEAGGFAGPGGVEKPAGAGRSFYDAPGGEALYYPQGDLLYMNHGDRVKALCRASEGYCRIAVAGLGSEDVWLGTHLPLTLALVEMLKRKGRPSLHAAAFALDGRCVLLAGSSGVGKSTLTVCHLRAGLSFMGDDMTFFSESAGLKALAFPEPIDITDRTAAFFPELQQIARMPRRPGWPKHEVRASEVFGCAVTWSATLAAIVFPRIGQLGESRLSEIGSDEAFLELAPNVLLTDPASTREHVAFLSRLVQAVPCYRLDAARDFDRIPAITARLLQAPR